MVRINQQSHIRNSRGTHLPVCSGLCLQFTLVSTR